MGYSPWGRKESDMTERLSTYKERKIKGGYITVFMDWKNQYCQNSYTTQSNL